MRNRRKWEKGGSLVKTKKFAIAIKALTVCCHVSVKGSCHAWQSTDYPLWCSNHLVLLLWCSNELDVWHLSYITDLRLHFLSLCCINLSPHPHSTCWPCATSIYLSVPLLFSVYLSFSDSQFRFFVDSFHTLYLSISSLLLLSLSIPSFWSFFISFNYSN